MDEAQIWILFLNSGLADYLFKQLYLNKELWILSDSHGCVMLNSDDEDCVRISRLPADQEVLWNDNPCALVGGRAICQK